MQNTRFIYALMIGFAMLLSSFKPIGLGDPVQVLKEVSLKLASLNRIKYHYSREFNYPSEGYVAKTEGDMFIDFAKEQDLAGMRFKYEDDRGFSIFNNAEFFSANQQSKTIAISKIAAQKDLEGRSPLFNSIVTLRNILPLIIKNEGIKKTMSDTTIKGKTYLQLRFCLQNQYFNYLGTDFSKTTKELTFEYRIIVDQATYLPFLLLQTTLNTGDLSKTSFTDIDTNSIALQEKSWYYSSYLPNYTIEAPKVLIMPIKSGVLAPDWELLNFKTGEKEKLSKHQGKTILLEFWIKNCGYCIEAVPKLNELNALYASKYFKLLAINTEDSRNNIALFVDKHPSSYSVVYGDDSSINKKYGISGFPQAVLIGKDGRVIYAGSLDINLIKSHIEKNL